MKASRLQGALQAWRKHLPAPQDDASVPARRRFLQTLAGAGVASLAGCSFGGEYHDFEAENRGDDAETVRVAWDDHEEQFSLDPDESVSRHDLLPDEGTTTIEVSAANAYEELEWTGSGTLAVDIDVFDVSIDRVYDD